MTSALAWGCRAFAAVLIFLFSCTLVMAADPAAPPVTATAFAGALQMLFGLGIVLAAIAGTAWLLRRLAPGQAGSAGDLRVVAAVAVGPKERVVLVDIGEIRLVLGVAPGHVTRLLEMPRPEDIDLPQSGPIVVPFVDKLKALIATRGTAK
ncbi:MAG: flagellar biosynthetic protein FliO [Methylophilales bacterium RIFCSPHIGHO2_02_FULL_57_10]|nr:MAG: flagellar biosynthetic protein FliO [Methylophilales bacterium RIFCSPHIGHO2_02_FULL_57_10]